MRVLFASRIGIGKARKTEAARETPSEQDKSQQNAQRNQCWVTLVGGERSHYSAVPAAQEKLVRIIKTFLNSSESSSIELETSTVYYQKVVFC